MSWIRRFFGHLWTVLRHKYWVFIFACKCGIPIRGFFHDFSKFSPVEFFESVKYFTGTDSPINKAKKEKGYSKAWFHHRGRNKHHYEYWVDWLDSGGIPVKMPYKYVVEMICDYLAAAITYRQGEFSYLKEYQWWEHREMYANMHKDTKKLVTSIFTSLITVDDNVVFKRIRSGYYKKIYESNN